MTEAAVPQDLQAGDSHTREGRRVGPGAVWQLIKPYWVSERKWRARALLATVVLLALGMVYLNVQFNAWNRDFFNALESKDFAAFREQLLRFSGLAFLYIVVAIYRVYLTQALEIDWRAWMTGQYMRRWLDNQTYYRMEQGGQADNPDQRIAEDLKFLTEGTLTLSLGLLSAVVTLVSFVGILWSVSGPLDFMLGSTEYSVPGYMVWFAVAYAVLGSWLVARIGRPLIGQNFLQQRFEADFRFGLVRVRENSEAIALYGGEREEERAMQGRFARIRDNWWAIMRTTKRLNLASNFYAQFAIIFPFLVAAPRYFSGGLQLGGLMQISSAFGQVQEALSWFIEAYSSLAEWKASANRLAGFHSAVERLREQASGITVERNNVGGLLVQDLALALPNGEELCTPFSAEILPGQRILVTGPSGCGKSTLLRAIAGIWPYGRGMIEIPASQRLLFLPQRTYLPIGSLRESLTYPADPAAFTTLAIQHYLALCRLEHLSGLLDVHDNWSQRLSPGEQQRLALVRALLIAPDCLFLDEVSSALDAHTESLLYGLLLEQLPKTTIVSVGHRAALEQFHGLRWSFEPSAADEQGKPYQVKSQTISASGARRRSSDT